MIINYNYIKVLYVICNNILYLDRRLVEYYIVILIIFKFYIYIDICIDIQINILNGVNYNKQFSFY